MPALCALAYVSSATRPLSEAELEALLTDARANNERVQVTGTLLYHDGSFFQYLEGPQPGVDEVYARIKASRQHRGLIELVHGAVDRRHFDAWQMGFSHAPRSVMLQLSQAAWMRASTQQAEAADQSDGIKLLLAFWHTATRQG